jgi:methylphosphotriester-DNA--protein-cysteine methyltransferase
MEKQRCRLIDLEESMITAENKKEYYQALIDKKTEYEGIFFVGALRTKRIE